MIESALERHRRSLGVTVALLLPATLVGGATLLGRDWPSWRGPEQNGVSRETGLPDSWSPTGDRKNLLWTAPYGARSAPVVFGDRLYLLNLAGEGENRQERVLCLDARTGALRWEHRFNVFLTDIPDTRVGWSNPAVDPETGYVYVHGVQGLLKCLDAEGRMVWQRSLTEEFGRISGYGGRTHTPVIDEDRVVISFLNSSWGNQARGGHRYLALDKRTGEVVWWAEPGGRPLDTTYSVPVVSVVDGKRLLIAGNADGGIYAMKARTGEKVWGFRLSKRGINVSVVERDGIVYACHSEENIDEASMGRVVAIDATGTGDVTTTHEKWRAGGLLVGYSSPALVGNQLIVIDNSANVVSLDARTGEEKWRCNIGTVMKASPVVADGKIYVGAVSGTFSVLKFGEDRCETSSRVEFSTPDGRVIELNGSPCVAHGRVYLTTREAIYAIGTGEGEDEAHAPVELSLEDPPASDARPAHLQVLPGEVAVAPGSTTEFRARVFDAEGRLLREVKPSWTREQIPGGMSAGGRLEIPADSWYQGGLVRAQLGGLNAEARVRVVPALPVSTNFEGVPPGQVPPGWVGASPVKYQVVQLEGTKALRKLPDSPRFIESEIYFGLPEWRGYTIQSSVMGTRTKRRQMPNIGLIANRYFLVLMGNVQRLRLVSWVPLPRVEKTASFAWKPDVWYQLKLRVDLDGDTGLVRGKVWPRSESEPDTWTIELSDPCPNRSGAAGLHGYSAGATDRFPGADIFYDNIVVTPN